MSETIINRKIGLRQKIETGIYNLRVGEKVIWHDRKPYFTDQEIQKLRLTEDVRSILIYPEELHPAMIIAEEKLANMFGDYVESNSFTSNKDRVFIFKHDTKTNHLMEFKDRIRGIDKIHASDNSRRLNRRGRHERTLGTFIRGITLANEIDNEKLSSVMNDIRVRLSKNGYSSDALSESSVKTMIYSTVLVHERIHALDKFFSKAAFYKLSEPAAYLFEYRTMTKGMNAKELLAYDTIYEKYFDRGVDSAENMKKDPEFFQRIGGFNHMKAILATGKASLKERFMLLKIAQS